MTWPKIVLLIWIVLSALTVIGQIGKPRKPTTPEAAVATTLLLAGLCWLVVIA